MKETESVSRRKFIGTSAIAGAAASFPYVAKGEALQSDTIKVAVVGLGGRGSGAISQILDAPKDLGKRQKYSLQHKISSCSRCVS
jgi:nitrous oxide reductase